MATKLPIPALNTPGITTDFDLLREAGIAHIANLSGNLWTDFNSHDPGITILEVLSYALTDLGFRTDFPLQDLLASAPEEDASKQFFTAAEILPSNPITSNDLRKILIDIPEIKNAWFFPSEGELVVREYFFSRSAEELLEFGRLANQFLNPEEPHNEEFIATSFEELIQKLPEEIRPFQEDLYYSLVRFTKGNYLIDVENKDNLNFLGPLAPIYYLLVGCLFELKDEDIKCLDFQASCSLEEQLRLLSAKLKEIWEALKVNNSNPALDEFIQGLPQYVKTHRDLIIERFFSWRLVCKETKELPPDTTGLCGLYNVLIELQDDIDSENTLVTNKIEEEAFKQLHNYRNLGEDIQEIQFIGIKEIQLDGCIEIDSQANQDEVKAQIAFAIQRYLNPPIFFYSLQEMLDKGKSCEEIFQTVTLEHGFLDEFELEQAQLRRVVYLSDLYQIIMDVPGVKSVRQLKIDLCNPSDRIIENEEEASEEELKSAAPYRNPWCLDICQKEQKLADEARADNGEVSPYSAALVCPYKPILSLDCLNLLVLKEQYPQILDTQEVKERLDLLHLLNGQQALSGVRDKALPLGTYRNLHECFSIQEDFPMVYRVGKGELPATASAQHKAQVHQLKVFLTFFDQILVNYIAALKNLKNNFAVGQDPENPVFFAKSLREIVPNFPHYLIDFYQVSEDLVKIIQSEENCNPEVIQILQSFLEREPMEKGRFFDELMEQLGSHWQEDWEALFLQHGLLTDYYEQRLKELVEQQTRSYQSKNQLLDHLIARFGESFTDFALSIVQSMPYNACKAPQVELKNKQIACKVDFLKHIPILGRDKVKGFNMLAPDCSDPLRFWDADNVPGLKKRVSKLLCLPPSTAIRTRLSATPGVIVGKNLDVERKSFKWSVVQENETIQELTRTKKSRILVQKDATIFLNGVKTYSRNAKAEKDRLQLYDSLLDANRKIQVNGILEPQLIIRRVELEGDDSLESPYFELALRNARGTDIGVSPALENQQKAEDLKKQLLDLVFPQNVGDGGFHILEHVLLRPLDKDIPLLKPFTVLPNNTNIAEKIAQGTEVEEPIEPCMILDPYSFWITVIAPEDWDRFPPGSARTLFEQTVRREAPAHLGIRFCWLDAERLFQFEEAYKNWLYDVGRRQSDECQIEETLTTLIEIVNKLESKNTSETS